MITLDENTSAPPPRPLLLTGFKGCGKSTVGRLLARRLDAVFADLDTILEDLYAERPESGGSRLPFREIFRRLGGDAFRELERKAAERLAELAAQATASGDRPMVIALGGGALMREDTREILRKTGTILYLRVPLEEILRRARQTGFPAFLDGSPNPEQEFTDLFHRREPVYLEHADLVIDLGTAPPGNAAEIIARAIGASEQEK